MSQLEDDDVFDVNDYRDVISSSNQQAAPPPPPQQLRLTSTGSLDYDFYEDMDERDSIYLDAVSISSDGTTNARKSLYLSRQTVYHSAEELQQDSALHDGTLRTIKATTESLLNDSRANGGLPNLPYEPRASGSATSGSFGGGILKRPGMTTQYNEEVATSTSPLLLDNHSSTFDHSTTNQTDSQTISTNNRQHQQQQHPDRCSKHEPRQIVTYSLWKTRVKA